MALSPAREVPVPLVEARPKRGGVRFSQGWWLYLLLFLGLLLVVGPFI